LCILSNFFKMRFGFEDVDEADKTLEEVGTVFNVSRERVRQFEKRPCVSCAAIMSFELCWLRLNFFETTELSSV